MSPESSDVRAMMIVSFVIWNIESVYSKLMSGNYWFAKLHLENGELKKQNFLRLLDIYSSLSREILFSLIWT